MKYQIKHQNKQTGKTILCFEFVADDNSQLDKAVQKAWEEYPPPPGHVFLLCNQYSAHFEPVNQVT